MKGLAWGVKRFRDHLLFLPRSPPQPARLPSVPWVCFSNIPPFLCLRLPTTHPRSLQACLPGEQCCPSAGAADSDQLSRGSAGAAWLPTGWEAVTGHRRKLLLWLPWSVFWALSVGCERGDVCPIGVVGELPLQLRGQPWARPGAGRG